MIIQNETIWFVGTVRIPQADYEVLIINLRQSDFISEKSNMKIQPFCILNRNFCVETLLCYVITLYFLHFIHTRVVSYVVARESFLKL